MNTLDLEIHHVAAKSLLGSSDGYEALVRSGVLNDVHSAFRALAAQDPDLVAKVEGEHKRLNSEAEGLRIQAQSEGNIRVAGKLLNRAAALDDSATNLSDQAVYDRVAQNPDNLDKIPGMVADKQRYKEFVKLNTVRLPSNGYEGTSEIKESLGSVHVGRHDDSIDDDVREQLDRVPNGGWNQLKKELGDARNTLESGETPLNSRSQEAFNEYLERIEIPRLTNQVKERENQIESGASNRADLAKQNEVDNQFIDRFKERIEKSREMISKTDPSLYRVNEQGKLEPNLALNADTGKIVPIDQSEIDTGKQVPLKPPLSEDQNRHLTQQLDDTFKLHGHEKHHVLQQNAENEKVLKKFGIENPQKFLDDSSNLVVLRTSENVPLREGKVKVDGVQLDYGKSIHNGPHPQPQDEVDNQSKKIEERLQAKLEEMKKAKPGTTKLTENEAREALAPYLKQERSRVIDEGVELRTPETIRQQKAAYDELKPKPVVQQQSPSLKQGDPPGESQLDQRVAGEPRAPTVEPRLAPSESNYGGISIKPPEARIAPEEPKVAVAEPKVAVVDPKEVPKPKVAPGESDSVAPADPAKLTEPRVTSVDPAKPEVPKVTGNYSDISLGGAEKTPGLFSTEGALKAGGKLAVGVGAGVTVYEMGSHIAQGQYKEATRDGLSFAGSMGGALLGGETGAGLGALTGPAAPIAVPVLTVAGTLVGGIVGDQATRALVDGVCEEAEAVANTKVGKDVIQTAQDGVGMLKDLGHELAQTEVGKAIDQGTQQAAKGLEVIENSDAVKATESFVSQNLDYAKKGLEVVENSDAAKATESFVSQNYDYAKKGLEVVENSDAAKATENFVSQNYDYAKKGLEVVQNSDAAKATENFVSQNYDYAKKGLEVVQNSDAAKATDSFVSENYTYAKKGLGVVEDAVQSQVQSAQQTVRGMVNVVGEVGTYVEHTSVGQAIIQGGEHVKDEITQQLGQTQLGRDALKIGGDLENVAGDVKENVQSYYDYFTGASTPSAPTAPPTSPATPEPLYPEHPVDVRPEIAQMHTELVHHFDATPRDKDLAETYHREVADAKDNVETGKALGLPTDHVTESYNQKLETAQTTAKEDIQSRQATQTAMTSFAHQNLDQQQSTGVKV